MITQIFAGCTYVAGKDFGDNDGQAIVVPGDKEATLTLDYPFDEKLVIKMDRPGGYTKDALITVIRDGFDVMYNGAESTPIPGLINVKVEGEFGEAFHCIEDLVIEEILYDDEINEVKVSIGS